MLHALIPTLAALVDRPQQHQQARQQQDRAASATCTPGEILSYHLSSVLRPSKSSNFSYHFDDVGQLRNSSLPFSSSTSLSSNSTTAISSAHIERSWSGAPDAILLLSPDERARILFANDQCGHLLQLDSSKPKGQALVERSLWEWMNAQDKAAVVAAIGVCVFSRARRDGCNAPSTAPAPLSRCSHEWRCSSRGTRSHSTITNNGNDSKKQ